MAEQDADVIESWRANARAWIRALDEKAIASRERVTNAAIVDAVLACKPESVMDLGCGEGWLARALSAHGIAVHGFDAVEPLVDRARALGGGFFYPFSFADFVAGRVHLQADVLVFNFSLLDQHSVEALMPVLPRRLKPGGTLLIQTLHPAQVPQAQAGTWQREDWQGMTTAFAEPAPWFFRSPDQWQALLHDSGFADVALETVRDGASDAVASLLITARPS
ncbi:MAG: methyltransferase domain-containing protein [Alcanivoracaceae bacterium]|nr:methyltransferase domain-containing protein [Alcanivoracaceae bacterium]